MSDQIETRILLCIYDAIPCHCHCPVRVLCRKSQSRYQPKASKPPDNIMRFLFWCIPDKIKYCMVSYCYPHLFTITELRNRDAEPRKLHATTPNIGVDPFSTFIVFGCSSTFLAASSACRSCSIRAPTSFCLVANPCNASSWQRQYCQRS